MTINNTDQLLAVPNGEAIITHTGRLYQACDTDFGWGDERLWISVGDLKLITTETLIDECPFPARKAQGIQQLQTATSFESTYARASQTWREAENIPENDDKIDAFAAGFIAGIAAAKIGITFS